MHELVLITGCACELGQATAVACAEAGLHVICTTKHPRPLSEQLESTIQEKKLAIEFEQLDVSSPKVGAKVRELVLKYGPIYGLVNNAAVAISGAFEEQSERDAWEQFETNVLGLMAVTRALLPSMRAAERARIVNVSSISGRLAIPGLTTYTATTHAVEGFSEALRLEVQPFGVEVCLVEAGTVKHVILLGNMKKAEHADPAGPYAAMTEVVQRAVLQTAEKGPSTDAVASAIVKVLQDPAPPYRTLVGLNARTMMALRKVIPDSLFADGVRRYIGLPAAKGRSR